MPITGEGIFGLPKNIEHEIIQNVVLSKATGDEYAYTLNYEINKATSGDAYGLRINVTDTLSPGSIYPFSISDNSIIVKDGMVGVGRTPVKQLDIDNQLRVIGDDLTDNIIINLHRGSADNSLFGLPGADGSWIPEALQGDFVIRSEPTKNILLGSSNGAGVSVDGSTLNVGIKKYTALSALDVGGSFGVKRVATAVDVSTDDEVIIGVTDTSAARTITILSADIVANRLFIIKDESGAAGTNNITVATEGAETIDGAASYTISTNYGVVRMYSDGTNLYTW